MEDMRLQCSSRMTRWSCPTPQPITLLVHPLGVKYTLMWSGEQRRRTTTLLWRDDDRWVSALRAFISVGNSRFLSPVSHTARRQARKPVHERCCLGNRSSAVQLQSATTSGERGAYHTFTCASYPLRNAARCVRARQESDSGIEDQSLPWRRCRSSFTKRVGIRTQQRTNSCRP
jgi:hypothetical protein